MRQEDFQFWVYILASRSRTLYVGLTNSLHRRVNEHREQGLGSFTARYNISRLVYCEQFQYIDNALPARRVEEVDESTEDRIDRGRKSNLGRPDAV